MRSQFLNEHCFWSQECSSKSMKHNHSLEKYCQLNNNSKTVPFYIIPKNVSSSGKENLNEIFLSETNTANIVDKKTSNNQIIIIVITGLIFSTAFFILLIIFIRQKSTSSFKKLLLNKLKRIDKLKTTRNCSFFSKKLHSIAKINKRTENIYVNNLAESSFKNKEPIYFSKAGQHSSDLILDVSSLSIRVPPSDMGSFKSYQIKQTELENQKVKINKKEDCNISVEKRNFIIATENDEIHFENNFVGNHLIS